VGQFNLIDLQWIFELETRPAIAHDKTWGWKLMDAHFGTGRA
jgi:hypothetical protein